MIAGGGEYKGIYNGRALKLHNELDLHQATAANECFAAYIKQTFMRTNLQN